MIKQEILQFVSKASMKWPIRALLSFLVVLGLISIVFSGLEGDLHGVQATEVKDKSIAGKWEFSASGFNVPPYSSVNPVVAVGTMTFDETGGCFLSGIFNANGSVSTTDFVCSYTVNVDGTGEISAPSAAFVSMSFVIVDKYDEFRFIVTGLSGNVMSGVARRQ